MARKSKGRGGGRGGGASSSGGNGSGPSSSSPAPRPQQEAAAAGSSTSSPIPCPPGYLWDGKRFYKMPPNLSRVRITDGSSSDSDCPRKEPRSDASSSSPARRTAKRREQHHGAKLSPLEDVTVIALAGEDDNEDGLNIKSPFDFTPAKPPAAHLSVASSSCGATSGPPRDAAPSMAFAKRWKMHAKQRLVDSYKFHSRDVVDQELVPVESSEREYYMPGEGGPASEVRIDTFDVTGGLIWLQAEGKFGHAPLFNNTEDEHITRGATFLESAGRSYAQERFIPAWEPHDDASPSEQQELEDDSWDPYGHLYHLPYSHMGFSSTRYPWLDQDEYDTRLYSFSRKSSLPRGLAGTNHKLSSRAQWPEYPMSKMDRTLNFQVDPELLFDTNCYDLLHPAVAHQGSTRPTNLNVALKIGYGEIGEQICQIHWAPSGKTILYVRAPHKQQHSAIALNEGSALCWMGYSDGHVELFDVAGYTTNVISSYTVYEQLTETLFEAHNLPPPTVFSALEISSTRGAVSSLNAVGPREVVATFSKGAMLLLRATSSQHVEVVREFFGCIGKGSRLDDPAVDAGSRLVAIVDKDKHVRIWHLDDPYPLNTPWHRKRKRSEEPLDLLPEPLSQHSKLLQRTKAASSHGSEDSDAEITPRKHKDKFVDPLALRPLTNRVTQTVMKKRLGDLRLWSHVGMTFSPTAWVADRDVQWEFTREFKKGKPKLVGAGFFAGLTFCISSPRGPALVYFEPEKRPSVVMEGEGGTSGVGEGDGGEGVQRE